MEYLPIGVVNGINFSEYVPCEKGYNTIVYVHKSVLEKQKEGKEEKQPKKRFFRKFKRSKKNNDKEKNKKTEVVEKIDKSIQFDEEVVRNDVYTVAVHNDPILEHTIQMAKNILPLIIRGDDPNVFYTIKTKKSKRKADLDAKEVKPDNITYKKERSKRVVETFKNDKIMNQRESLSIKETVSFSSSTLDEVQYPPSCCSLSEISEKKPRKKEQQLENKPKTNAKVIASESFEALANEVLNNAGDAKLKIHLMNEADKNILADNIRIPVLNAIRDCISEIIARNDYSNKGLDNMQRAVQSSADKLDGVVYRLANIEQKLDYIIKDINKIKAKSPRTPRKVSTLEQLGEDMEEQNTEDEEYYREREREEKRRYDYERQRKKAQSNVVPLTPRIEIETIDKGHETGGCGEDHPGGSMPPAKLLSAPERQTRIPARYCWTEANRHHS